MPHVGTRGRPFVHDCSVYVVPSFLPSLYSPLHSNARDATLNTTVFELLEGSKLTLLGRFHDDTSLCVLFPFIVESDYGLDDRVIKVQYPTGAEDFSSSPCVQTGSKAHPASYPMGTRGPFPDGKARPGCDADHSPPSSG
jgi:hypothetical protein